MYKTVILKNNVVMKSVMMHMFFMIFCAVLFVFSEVDVHALSMNELPAYENESENTDSILDKTTIKKDMNDVLAENTSEDLSTNSADDLVFGECELSTETNTSVAGISFVFHDARGSAYDKVLDGSDGKYAIYVFGDVTSPEVQALLLGFKKMYGAIDSSWINIYVFDSRNDDSQVIAQAMNDMDLGDAVVACHETYGMYTDTYFRANCGCLSGISPIWVLKCPDGSVERWFRYGWWGSLAKKMQEEGGMTPILDDSTIVAPVKGIDSYSNATVLLNLINAKRNANGANSLKMDRDMYNSAMMRAAETAILDSDTRPSGYSNKSSSRKMQKELRVVEAASAQEALDELLASSEGASLLSNAYCSIGVGSFCIHDNWYWVVQLGTEYEAINISYQDKTVTHYVYCNEQYGPRYSMQLCSGDKTYLWPSIIQGETYVPRIMCGDLELDPSAFYWDYRFRSDCEYGLIELGETGAVTTDKDYDLKDSGYTTIVLEASCMTFSYEMTMHVCKYTEGESSTKSVDYFVERMYQLALQRRYDWEGYFYWTGKLQSNELSGADLAAQFIESPEFEGRNLSDQKYIEILYAVFFDRRADKEGMKYWKNELASGKDRHEILAGFVNSEEFAKVCSDYGITRGIMFGKNEKARDNIYHYVMRMYTKALDRIGEDEGALYWTFLIENHCMSAEDVAKEFFNSPEFLNKNLSDDEFIRVLYRTFMGREYDVEGLFYWRNQMRYGKTRNEVLEEFARSQEFKNIMAGFGL